MTIDVYQIVFLSQSVAKAHERVEKMKQELQYIQDFSGMGYCSISLSSKQRTVSIDFEQLMEMYEDSLLPALQYVAEQRVKQAEKDLEEVAAKLREACGVLPATVMGENTTVLKQLPNRVVDII